MSGPPADRDELDRRIREAFSNAGSPVAPDTLRASLERLPAAALGRQPTRRPLGLSGAIIIAVALVLVGAVVANRLQAPAATPPPTAAPMASPSASAEVASSGPPASAVALVPWSAATPPPQPRLPTPRPVPPGTRACTAADLAATADWQGATGSMAGGIVATNVGSTACVLDGPPSDVVVHAGPTTMPTTYAGDRGHGPDGAIPSGPALLEPGERGVWWLSWTNWCGSDLVASSVTVTLPDGSGPLVAGPDPSSPNPGLGTPRCDAPDDPSSLTVFSFVAQPPEGPIPEGQAASAVITVPSTATAGEDLTFTVALTNLGDWPAAFDPCPTYSEDLIVTGARLKPPADRHYALNCGAMPPALAPGATIVLEMRYPVPSRVPPGPTELLWSMDPGGPFDTGAFGRVPIKVAGGG